MLVNNTCNNILYVHKKKSLIFKNVKILALVFRSFGVILEDLFYISFIFPFFFSCATFSIYIYAKLIIMGFIGMKLSFHCLMSVSF